MRGVTLDFSRPGKPTDNAFIESFNGKFRAERLNAHWFLSLDEARRKCEAWRRDYNDVRRHSAIGGKTPKELPPAVGAPASQPPDEAGFPGQDRSSVGGKVKRPENSTFGRSKEWGQSTKGRTPTPRGRKTQ